MLFYKVKIERAIKGNKSVNGQWPTILLPLTLWTFALVLLLWYVPLWSSLSTRTYLNPELHFRLRRSINILKLHYAMCDWWPQMADNVVGYYVAWYLPCLGFKEVIETCREGKQAAVFKESGFISSIRKWFSASAFTR